MLANRRANEALVESRKAAANALWSRVQEAVQRMIGFDPTSEPVGERLAHLRIAMIAMVDELPDWPVWTNGWRPNAPLAQRSDGRSWSGRSQGDTVNERMLALAPYQRWAQVLGATCVGSGPSATTPSLQRSSGSTPRTS